MELSNTSQRWSSRRSLRGRYRATGQSGALDIWIRVISNRRWTPVDWIMMGLNDEERHRCVGTLKDDIDRDTRRIGQDRIIGMNELLHAGKSKARPS